MTQQPTSFLPPSLLHNVIVFDIEVAPIKMEYAQLDDRTRDAWDEYINRYDRKERATLLEKYTGKQTFEEAMWLEKASFLAEFSQIVAFACASWSKKENLLVCNSWSYESETDVLKAAHKPLDNDKYHLCGHYIGGYDLRMMLQRYFVNMPADIPFHLRTFDKKPWELKVIDTINVWNPGFGARSAGGTSLDRMCMAFNIPTPKSDISGADVARVFHKDRNRKRIAEYCAQDVIANAHCVAQFCGMPGYYMQTEPKVIIKHD